MTILYQESSVFKITPYGVILFFRLLVDDVFFQRRVEFLKFHFFLILSTFAVFLSASPVDVL